MRRCVSDYVVMDAGAFQLAINVLERAGKAEVAQELRVSAFKLDDPYAAFIRDALVQDIYESDKENPENCL